MASTYQSILDTQIKPHIKKLAMRDVQTRDNAIRNIIQKTFPQYDATFFTAVSPAIHRCMDTEYKGPDKPDPEKYGILNSHLIDDTTNEAKEKALKQLKKVAKNWWHQNWSIWDQLFANHFLFLHEFCPPDMRIRDSLIHQIFETKIKLAPRSKRQRLIKCSTITKGNALHEALETFRPGLDLQTLKTRLAETKKQNNKRVGSTEFAAESRTLCAQLNQNRDANSAHHRLQYNARHVQRNAGIDNNASFEDIVPNADELNRGSPDGAYSFAPFNESPFNESPLTVLSEWNVEHSMNGDPLQIQNMYHPMTVEDRGIRPHEMEHKEATMPVMEPIPPLHTNHNNTVAAVDPFNRNSNHVYPPRGYGNVRGGNPMYCAQQHRYNPYYPPYCNYHGCACRYCDH